MVPIIAALMVSRMVHFDRFLLRFNTHRSSIKPSNDNKKKKKIYKKFAVEAKRRWNCATETRIRRGIDRDGMICRG